ncbi:MAG: hypothetical protein PHT07_12405 [Paludibacter sp.]|nr:hypothetical protein [Paludibacter sp.]
MHFIVSWDIPTATNNRDGFERQLIDCFNSYQHVKPLTTFYIINVPSQTDYSNIFTNLQNVGKTIPESFRLIVSPIMTGGRYDGLHDNETWMLINKISG